MQKSIFTRLLDHGYGFYVEPPHSVKALYRVISDDLLDIKEARLFLYKENDNIVFGKRQRLTITDSVGRYRHNFVGFHPSSAEEIPSLTALQSQFPLIDEEVLEAHSALDVKQNCGDTLKDTALHPMRDMHPLTEESDWDKAVGALDKEPFVLRMFDLKGKEQNIPKRLLPEEHKIIEYAESVSESPEKKPSCQPQRSSILQWIARFLRHLFQRIAR